MRDAYYDVLSGLTESEFFKGIKGVIANCAFFPTSAQIKNYAYDGKTDEERAQDALKQQVIASLPSREMNMSLEEVVENKRDFAKYHKLRQRLNLSHEEALQALADGVEVVSDSYDALISSPLPVPQRKSVKEEYIESEAHIALIEKNRIAALKYLEKFAEVE